MFRGINAINMDVKGRMAIPTRYRETLTADKLVVTIDTEEACLLLYPEKNWQKIEESLQKLPGFNAHVRRIQRLLIGHATDVEVDANGRILLPSLLRDYAKLDKKVVLLGQGNKFEIWDEDWWKSRRDVWLQEKIMDALPEEMKNISL